MKAASSQKSYFFVWGLLLLLLFLTWIAAQFKLGPFQIIIALAIAVAKTVLVIGYFMHVRSAGRLTRVFVIAGFFWLGILIVLGMNDYLSRGWIGER